MQITPRILTFFLDADNTSHSHIFSGHGTWVQTYGQTYIKATKPGVVLDNTMLCTLYLCESKCKVLSALRCLFYIFHLAFTLLDFHLSGVPQKYRLGHLAARFPKFLKYISDHFSLFAISTMG